MTTTANPSGTEYTSRWRLALHAVVYALRVGASAVGGLFKDNCMRNAAALSFYALFSIAPIIYLAVYVAGILAADVDFQQQITQQFAELLGEQAAEGVNVLLSTLETQQQNQFQLVLGIGVLVFSATNIFVQIQNTFNEVFCVQPRASAGIVKHVLDRAVSLGIIFSLGFLLIVSLILDSVVLAFHQYLFELLNAAAVIIVQIVQMLFLVVLITGVIYGMFHFLPDVYLPRYLKLRGSLFVAASLLLGKYGIGLYIANSKLSELGGASASIFVLMLWIYYTSIILFFGAELIRAMADRDRADLPPRRYATRIRTVVVDDDATQPQAAAQAAEEVKADSSSVEESLDAPAGSR
ncbi:MAG: YihY/virulence factor BrkB family protein [Halioglobus sp.]|nr:YihY/virulence factor BrkB family protein [Halioglobus sp.]